MSEELKIVVPKRLTDAFMTFLEFGATHARAGLTSIELTEKEIELLQFVEQIMSSYHCSKQEIK